MSTYTPGQVPDDAANLPGFMRLELAAIKQAQERAQLFIRLKPATVAPTKYPGRLP